jgi:hypothetical protein
MPSLHDPDDYRIALARVERLSPERQPRWGRMSVDQMLCHLRDYFDLALGRTTGKPLGNALTQAAARWLVLTVGMRFPRNVRTLPQFKQTSPEVFDHDHARLRDCLQEFHRRRDRAEWPYNPAFGKLTREQWGRLAWLHVDHHLRQFGV